MRSARAPFVFSLCGLLAGVAAAQEPAPTPAQEPERPAGTGREAPSLDPKPYDRVITKDAKTDEGLFRVHRIKEKLYYEIPKAELGKQFLWVSQIARTTLGVGYGGQALGNRVVRFERVNNRILLRNVAYDVVADKSLPIARAVQAANNDTIVMSFNIEALAKDDAAVIDVTRLFTTDVAELSARARLRARGFDASRSFVERAVSFPDNIEVEVTHTYTSPIDPPTPSTQPTPPPNPFQGAGMRPGSASVLMHYSMVRLPDKPMTPRLFDERVGYFSVRQLDYGKDEQRAPQRRYITRWRLEKKEPSAALSEPVKPIVYYIDPATPTKWVPYLKQGVESWQAAFEAAGFKNAILAKEAPAPSEDPDWSPEDARYSVIRWLPSTIENAMGPHIHDPRTGEILESDIQFFHNVMKLLGNWYFVQVAHLDPRAQKLPFSDDLMGALLAHVTAHEVGHTLGFQHNMKASSMYPAEKVRDREWVKKMGHTPTLMDYSRFNYVAQPEDKIDLPDLIPGIGPYDKWATMWGYASIPDARTAEDEKPTLDQWARQQDDKPWLRFSTEGAAGSDPGELTEAVGDADAVASTALGVKNLARNASLLLAATSKTGEPWDDTEELYGRLLGQWVLEMNHVSAIVGGYQSQQKHAGQQGVRFVLIPRARQLAAVKFLSDNAFVPPAFALNADVLRRIEPVGVLDRIKSAQARVLSTLLSTSRIARLVEQEALDGALAYKPTDFVADVRKGVWRELLSPGPVKVDAYRRNLQRAWIELHADRLNGRQAATDDARALFRGELRAAAASVATALAQASDRATRVHLEDARDLIAKALDPKFLPPAPSPFASPIRTFAEDVAPNDGWENPLACWPDYTIRRPQPGPRH